MKQLVTKGSIENQMNTEGIKVIRGNYDEKELIDRFDRKAITNKIVEEAIVAGKGRHHWMFFCINIEHCEHVCQELNERGINARYAHSKCDDSDENIEAFKRGECDAICSVNQITTGFDAPFVDYIVWMAPKMSSAEWIQGLGRGTRIFPGQADCLVKDFAGNIVRCGPFTDPVIPRKKGEKGGGKAPVRMCPQCARYQPASRRTCSECGLVFPILQKITTQADGSDIMGEKPADRKLGILNTSYKLHIQKGTGVKFISIDHIAEEGEIINEYITFDKKGYETYKAKQFWRESCGGSLPKNTTEALENIARLKKPSALCVEAKKKKGFYVITERHFDEV